MPFEELSHTADWCLRVWAADLESLFTEAAIGMNALAGIRLVSKPRVKRTFSASADDGESLLVSFLSELVYYAEQDQLAFDDFEVSLDPGPGKPMDLNVVLHGAPIFSMNKAIKAVTYHNLQIQNTKNGLEVEIVLDV
jgi:SHS2 domain-containing protein